MSQSQIPADVLGALASAPDEIEKMVRGVTSNEQVTKPGPGGIFSLVEQVWHLADLESEAFAVRIDRLLHEDAPALLDFDGERVAKERGYRNLSIEDGLKKFRASRQKNVEALSRLSKENLERWGVLAGVGRISLGDLPQMMLTHDASHRNEIESILRN